MNRIRRFDVHLREKERERELMFNLKQERLQKLI